MKPAIFLDRDGTLIEDRGHLGSLNEVYFYPETIPALKKLRNTFELIIITHQPGVASGLITMDQVDIVNSHVSGVLHEAGIAIRETYVCPHDRLEDCICIKPKPFFLLRAAKDYGLDLKRSFSIGDHPADVELARNLGGTGIFLLTGHGEKHHHELKADDIVVPGIGEAVEYILASLD